jgi:hypothetical protein
MSNSVSPPAYPGVYPGLIRHLGDWDLSAQSQNETPLLYDSPNAFSVNGDSEKLQNQLLPRPRAASAMLRMIIRRLLGAARLTTMRMQQPIPSASKLASGLAADPQHYR